MGAGFIDEVFLRTVWHYFLFTIPAALSRVEAARRGLSGGKEAPRLLTRRALSRAFVLSVSPAFPRRFVSKTAPLFGKRDGLPFTSLPPSQVSAIREFSRWRPAWYLISLT